MKKNLKKHLPSVCGLVLLGVLTALSAGPLDAWVQDLQFTPGLRSIWLRNMADFAIYFLCGAAMALLIAGGGAHGFRVRLPWAVGGCLVLAYCLLPLVLLGLDTGIPQWGVFSLLFPVGQGEFVRFPRYILFLLAGFLTVYGFYGRREV